MRFRSGELGWRVDLEEENGTTESTEVTELEEGTLPLSALLRATVPSIFTPCEPNWTSDPVAGLLGYFVGSCTRGVVLRKRNLGRGMGDIDRERPYEAGNPAVSVQPRILLHSTGSEPFPDSGNS